MGHMGNMETVALISCFQIFTGHTLWSSYLTELNKSINLSNRSYVVVMKNYTFKALTVSAKSIK
jgi:hypothetical protein